MGNNKKKLRVVAVSGGFDPLHIGHVRMFKEAKKLGDKLIVILNNDHWLMKKKGHIFMPQKERREVIESVKHVDEVVLTGHRPDPHDMSVCAELKKFKPDFFANGGDRKRGNIPEVAVCKKINCQLVFNVGYGGKIQSSSWLLKKYKKIHGKKINVGSKNKVKVGAVTEMVRDYAHLRASRVLAKEAPSGVSDQPKSLKETIQGAMNRAKYAFQNCDYSFGIESGLMAVPHTKTGFMDVCVCAIFDGKEFHLGLSSAWEAPKKVMHHMLTEGLDMNQAALKAGFTKNPQVGSAEGLVGIMTKGRLTRKEYTKEAIRMALIHLEEI